MPLKVYTWPIAFKFQTFYVRDAEDSDPFWRQGLRDLSCCRVCLDSAWLWLTVASISGAAGRLWEGVERLQASTVLSPMNGSIHAKKASVSEFTEVCLSYLLWSRRYEFPYLTGSRKRMIENISVCFQLIEFDWVVFLNRTAEQEHGWLIVQSLIC